MYASNKHHGAVQGVLPFCHNFSIDSHQVCVIDCGLFQGAETSALWSGFQSIRNEFDCLLVQALVITMFHIDHVGVCLIY